MSIYGSVLALLLAANAAPSPYPPVDSVTGFDSMVEAKAVEVATTPDQWNAEWQRHKGITPIGNSNNTSFPSIEQPPTINFDQHEVLVIFGGLAPQGGYEIVDSVKTTKEVDVRIRPLSLATNGGRTPNSVRANPYLFVIYKKTQLPFAIQVQQTDQNGNVQWQTVARTGAKN